MNTAAHTLTQRFGDRGWNFHEQPNGRIIAWLRHGGRGCDDSYMSGPHAAVVKHVTGEDGARVERLAKSHAKRHPECTRADRFCTPRLIAGLNGPPPVFLDGRNPFKEPPDPAPDGGVYVLYARTD